MTKKKNRRFTKRRVRRALNKSLDFFTKVSGRRLSKIGLGKNQINEGPVSRR